MDNKKIIGILGGMGPEATVDLFHWIVRLTPAEEDSDHLHILIDNNPHVPSRIKAIMENGESPLPMLVKMAQGLKDLGADFLIIPCNTASYYIDALREKVQIPVLSIVEETAACTMLHHPNLKKVGLLATEAMVRVGLYQKELLKRKLDIVCLTEHTEIDKTVAKIRGRYFHLMGVENLDPNHCDRMFKVKSPMHDPINNQAPHPFYIFTPPLIFMRKLVMRAIFGSKGIKAGYHSLPRELLIKAAHQLIHQGAEVIIMGCTEIPLVLRQSDVKVPLINPTKILAQSAIDFALGKEACQL